MAFLTFQRKWSLVNIRVQTSDIRDPWGRFPASVAMVMYKDWIPFSCWTTASGSGCWNLKHVNTEWKHRSLWYPFGLFLFYSSKENVDCRPHTRRHTHSQAPSQYFYSKLDLPVVLVRNGPGQLLVHTQTRQNKKQLQSRKSFSGLSARRLQLDAAGAEALRTQEGGEEERGSVWLSLCRSGDGVQQRNSHHFYLNSHLTQGAKHRMASQPIPISRHRHETDAGHQSFQCLRRPPPHRYQQKLGHADNRKNITV